MFAIMLVLLTIFITSFLIALSGALMPGPLLTVTVSETTRRGLAAGPLLIVGHGLLELVLVIALLLGLGPVLRQEWVFITSSTAGSVILIWMAIGMFRALPSLSLEFNGDESGKGNLLISGALLSIANPYWTIWWVSIGLGYILHSFEFGKIGVFTFFTGHITADMLWYSAVSVTVWKGRAFLSDRTYRSLISFCAVFLLLFSCYFAYSGMKKLLF